MLYDKEATIYLLKSLNAFQMDIKGSINQTYTTTLVQRGWKDRKFLSFCENFATIVLDVETCSSTIEEYCKALQKKIDLLG